MTLTFSNGSIYPVQPLSSLNWELILGATFVPPAMMSLGYAEQRGMKEAIATASWVFVSFIGSVEDGGNE